VLFKILFTAKSAGKVEHSRDLFTPTLFSFSDGLAESFEIANVYDFVASLATRCLNLDQTLDPPRQLSLEVIVLLPFFAWR
jgi:hypothetical protein